MDPGAWFWALLVVAPYQGGPSQGLALGTAVLIVLWIFSEVSVRLYALLRGAPATVPRGQDRGSHLLLTACVVALLAVSLVDRTRPLLGPLPLWAIVAGEVLMAVGILVRVVAVAALGRFFTTRVTIQREHRLVSTGPYRWVRHPSYTGAFLTLLGFPLASGSLLGLLVGVPVLALGFLYRIHVEERALAAAFGADYEAYRSRTRRLLPGIY